MPEELMERSRAGPFYRLEEYDLVIYLVINARSYFIVVEETKDGKHRNRREFDWEAEAERDWVRQLNDLVENGEPVKWHEAYLVERAEAAEAEEKRREARREERKKNPPKPGPPVQWLEDDEKPKPGHIGLRRTGGLGLEVVSGKPAEKDDDE